MSFHHTLRVCGGTLPHHPRTFGTTTHILAPSFLDLQARAVSRENGHFSKLSGVNYIEHSPALQLLRSERDLAEGKDEQATGILLTQTKSDKTSVLLGEYERQVELLKTQLRTKEGTWQQRFNNERKEWEELEERALRLRLIFGALVVFAGLLAADGVALADEVEQHCPGCFGGNTKQQLFVVGYIKTITEGLARWWRGEAPPGTKGTTSAQVTAASSARPATAGDGKTGLPLGWEKMVTPEGRVYSANHSDKYTTWQHPRQPGTATGGLREGQKDAVLAESRPTPNEHTEENSSLWYRIMWAGPRGQ